MDNLSSSNMNDGCESSVYYGNPQSMIQGDFVTESHVESSAQPQYEKIKTAKKLTRGQKKLLKKHAKKQQMKEVEKMNLEIEQAKQKNELIDEILN